VNTVKYLNREEIERLFSVTKNKRDLAMFRLAYHHGLYGAEVGPLQLTDYELRHASDFDWMRIKGANEKLDRPVTLAMRSWLKTRGPVPGLLFSSDRNAVLAPGSLDLLMKRHCKRAAIPAHKSSFNTLRHTCAMAILSHPRRSILDIRRKMRVSNATCHRYAKLAARAKAREASLDLPEPATAVRALTAHYYEELVQRTKELEKGEWAGMHFPTEYVDATKEQDGSVLTGSDDGEIYFVETLDGRFIKIGYSTRPRRRFSEFGTLRPSPFALRLIGSFPGSIKTERWLHEKFQEDRDNGEWFRASDRLRAFIASVLA
jgi:hypothetical protein